MKLANLGDKEEFWESVLHYRQDLYILSCLIRMLSALMRLYRTWQKTKSPNDRKDIQAQNPET